MCDGACPVVETQRNKPLAARTGSGGTGENVIPEALTFGRGGIQPHILHNGR